MNRIAELINTIAEGIDPITGEVFDTESCRGNKEIEQSIERLQDVFCKIHSRGSYADFESRYPQHIIIAKEGYFYSVYDASAVVMNQLLGYKTWNRNGRLCTGSPNLEKMCQALSEKEYSFLVVEKKKMVRIENGKNPFADMASNSGKK